MSVHPQNYGQAQINDLKIINNVLMSVINNSVKQMNVCTGTEIPELSQKEKKQLKNVQQKWAQMKFQVNYYRKLSSQVAKMANNPKQFMIRNHDHTSSLNQQDRKNLVKLTQHLSMKHQKQNSQQIWQYLERRMQYVTDRFTNYKDITDLNLQIKQLRQLTPLYKIQKKLYESYKAIIDGFKKLGENLENNKNIRNNISKINNQQEQKVMMLQRYIKGLKTQLKQINECIHSQFNEHTKKQTVINELRILTKKNQQNQQVLLLYRQLINDGKQAYGIRNQEIEKQIESKISEFMENQGKLQSKIKEFEKVEMQLNALKNQIKLVFDRIREQTGIHMQQSNFSEIFECLNNFHQNNKEFKTEFNQKSSENQQLTNEISQLKKTIQEKENYIKTLTSKLNKMQNQIQSFCKGEEITISKHDLAQMFSSLKTQMSQMRKQIKNYQQEINQLKESEIVQTKSITDLQQTVTKVQKNNTEQLKIYTDQQKIANLLPICRNMIDKNNIIHKIVEIHQRQIKQIILKSRIRMNKGSLHKAIDGLPYMICIAQTVSGVIVGAYTEQPISNSMSNDKVAFLFSCVNGQFRTYFAKKGGKRVNYNNNLYLCFGASQIRFQTESNKLYSSFGMNIGKQYETQNIQFTDFFNVQKVSTTVEIMNYEFYQIIFNSNESYQKEINTERKFKTAMNCKQIESKIIESNLDENFQQKKQKQILNLKSEENGKQLVKLQKNAQKKKEQIDFKKREEQQNIELLKRQLNERQKKLTEITQQLEEQVQSKEELKQIREKFQRFDSQRKQQTSKILQMTQKIKEFQTVLQRNKNVIADWNKQSQKWENQKTMLLNEINQIKNINQKMIESEKQKEKNIMKVNIDAKELQLTKQELQNRLKENQSCINGLNAQIIKIKAKNECHKQEMQNIFEQKDKLTLKLQEKQKTISQTMSQLNNNRNQEQKFKINQKQSKNKINQLKKQTQKLCMKCQQLQQQMKKLKQELQYQKALSFKLAKQQTKTSSIEKYLNSKIFEQKEQCEQKQFLINSIENLHGKYIRRTKLLFQYDSQININFHRYIDDKPGLLLIAQDQNNRLIGGYTQSALTSKKEEQKNNQGFLFVCDEQNLIFSLKPEKHALMYDNLYLIFGNAQIRIKVQELSMFSNFGIINSHYNSQGNTVDRILKKGKIRQCELKHYEIYQIIFNQQ